MTLADAAARELIYTDTAPTLFVNAGAGSGKTSALVQRVRTLVLVDGIRMSAIAAVTFTDKAGAELRDRLRAEFEKAWRTSDGDAKDVAAQALDDLDSAAIGTLHSFAQRLLAEHPIEAGLPPALEVMDEVGSSVAFEERWTGLQRDLLDDDTIAQPLLLGMALGVQLKHLRALAQRLGTDWDLIEERILTFQVQPLALPDIDPFLAAAADVVALAESCTKTDDKLVPKFVQLGAHVDELRTAPDLESRLAILERIGRIRYTYGQKGNWLRPIDEIKAAGQDLCEQATRIVGAVRDQCLRLLTRWIAERVVEAAQTRQGDGRLEFHDLLVLTRDVLRRHESVRADAHARYERLLLDEFQDTDPIQIELAVRIAAGAYGDAPQWQDVPVPSGRLFIVGDAKQSIYRFRRASIATYLGAQERIGTGTSLTTNFRAVAPIVDWVNTVFGQAIVATPGSQPDYTPLTPHRGQPEGGAAVTVLGAEPHPKGTRALALRDAEAGEVGAIVATALAERWQVFDESAESWRDARLGDIVILVPARTSLPNLQDKLDTAGVPWRAESSSLVYQAAEVRDLYACARAVADPSDALALVTALRSPPFGCGDDDLWTWRRDGGWFSITSPIPDTLTDTPVGAAITYLRRLHYAARWMSPSELLGAIISDRRMFEVAATGPGFRDAWRRLRFVVDQARAWSEASHGGLRAYLAWAGQQGLDAARVHEAVLPETDTDAVRIMTIHAAKGLEFPIVIMSGLTAQARRQSGVSLLWPPEGGYSVRLASAVQTDDFDVFQPLDEQMDVHERVRLLYVSATRARDHLVVSLHRAEESKSQTAAKLITDAGGLTGARTYAATGRESMGPAAVAEVTPPPDHAAWLAGITAARASADRPQAITASGLEGTEPEIVLADDAAEGAAKGPRDLELPPWSKGRYGSAIGRAVHAVLQTIDLATGAGLDQAVAGQCLAEGVVGQEQLVTSLVRSALDSDVVRYAAAREHWRETYVGTVRDDDTVLEGYVDLIYRDDDGTLVIVDYKTDAVPTGGLPSRVTYYTPQLTAYADALRAATGGPVADILLFLHPSTSTAAPIALKPD